MLSAEAKFHPWLHRIALLTACATFPLIFMGGLVTSHQAGMSVPDWPNSYGYNMFLFPPRLWIGGILYEHTHRLMGTIVGMLSIALTVTAWRTEIAFAFRWMWATTIAMTRRHLRWLPYSVPATTPPTRPPSAVERHLRWLAFSVLAAVIFQGILGGLRVVLVKLDLAIVHACVAQAFFCLATLVAIITSKWWVTAPAPVARASRPWIFRLACLTFFIIYLQLIAGELMRHHEAGLAIPDIPFAYGHLLPPTSADLDQINHLRAWQLNLPPVTLTQIAFHYTHRVGALLVTLASLSLIATIFLRHRSRALLLPAGILLIFLLTQLTLGIFTVLKRKPADIASFHVAVGALCLVTTFTIAIRAFRLYSLHVGSASADGISLSPSAEADPTSTLRPQMA